MVSGSNRFHGALPWSRPIGHDIGQVAHHREGLDIVRK